MSLYGVLCNIIYCDIYNVSNPGHSHLDDDHFVLSVVVVPSSHCEEDEHHNQDDCNNRGTDNDSFHMLRESWSSRA